MTTLIPGIREVRCSKYIDDSKIFLVPSGSQNMVQFCLNEAGKLEKVKEFPLEIEKTFSIGDIFYTQQIGIEETKDDTLPTFLTLLSEDQRSLAVVESEAPKENLLVAEMDNFQFG